MQEPFLDSTTLADQTRIREYVLGWLERLDYARKLERVWDADELGALIWGRIEREFAPVLPGVVVTNRPLAEVIAAATVEDYFVAYPERRASRYTVSGPLPDAGFRRCVLDFLSDLEEFEPTPVPRTPRAVSTEFWRHVAAHPERWGYSPREGAFVDDEGRAREVVLETIRDHLELVRRADERRGEEGAR